ncbi:13911_t:CDS:2 [Acaulospora morrowiae]|uniref:13911_t:CDS:1 n=1 Tax=Acaulospora morrowiae TaxID=94023 RepID=A0A9N8V9Q5_9GLOM|nr:13911_t:CDS:2 [Acaulospora morrowiae]
MGLPYNANCEKLLQDRLRAEELLQLFNNYKPIDDECYIVPQPPFYCDYGYNMHIGNSFIRILTDCNRVDIRDRLEERVKGDELAFPIKIGNDVWIGGGAIICPGITISDGFVVNIT